MNCPAVDLDLIMIEFDHERVCGLVEYKHELAALQYASHPTYRAIADLANRARVPFIACRYSDDLTWFKAHPLNDFAKTFLASPAKMTERQWVSLLYRIRGRAVPDDLFRDPVEWAHDMKAVANSSIREKITA